MHKTHLTFDTTVLLISLFDSRVLLIKHLIVGSYQVPKQMCLEVF